MEMTLDTYLKKLIKPEQFVKYVAKNKKLKNLEYSALKSAFIEKVNILYKGDENTVGAFADLLEFIMKLMVNTFRDKDSSLYSIIEEVDYLDNHIYYFSGWLVTQGVEYTFIKDIFSDIIEGIIADKGSKFYRNLLVQYKNKKSDDIQNNCNLPKTILPN